MLLAPSFFCFVGWIFLIIPLLIYMASLGKPREVRTWLDAVRIPHPRNQIRLLYRWERLETATEWAEGQVWFRPHTKELVLYSPQKAIEGKEFLLLPAWQIRGYWLVAHSNEIWLDVQIDNRWRLLKLSLVVLSSQVIRQGLQSICTEGQYEAFEASKPFTPRFSHAREMNQALTGEWRTGNDRQLYLSPAYLLLLNGWGDVHEMISTTAIDDIEALPRVDKEGTGILRFRAGGKVLNFSLPDWEQWAVVLAEVASKAQNTPIEVEIMDIKKKQDEE